MFSRHNNAEEVVVYRCGVCGDMSIRERCGVFVSGEVVPIMALSGSKNGKQPIKNLILFWIVKKRYIGIQRIFQRFKKYIKMKENFSAMRYFKELGAFLGDKKEGSEFFKDKKLILNDVEERISSLLIP